jgi:hypothetical protein
MPRKKYEEHVEEALHAFWGKIAELYPEVETGDLDPGHLIDLDTAAQSAVKAWLYYNHPDYKKVREHG